MFKVDAETYRITISTGGQPATVGPHGTVTWHEKIYIRGNDSDAILFFVDDPATAPPNIKSDTLPRVIMFFGRDRFEPCVEMLRNEGSVHVSLNENIPSRSTMGTGDEPVGQGGCCPGDLSDETADGTNATAQNYIYDRLATGAVGHDWANSHLLALSSYFVYGDWIVENNTGHEFFNDFVERFTPWMGPESKFDFVTDEHNIITHTGLQCMIMSTPRFIALTFRGTQRNMHDWQTNIPLPGQVLWAPNGVLTHRGWLAALDKSYYEILGHVVEHRTSTDQPLFVTGHSMGGALAQLMATKLTALNDHRVQGVYSYGAPLIARGSFAPYYEELELQERTHCWINGADFAPALPVPYGPVGAAHFINFDGVAQLNTMPPPINLPSDSDHDVIKYVNLIHDNLPADLRAEMPRA